MRYLFHILLFLSIMAGSSWADDTVGVLPAGLPDAEFFYLRMEREQTLTLDKIDYQLGPYRFGLFPFEVEPFGRIARVSDTRVSVFGSVRENAMSSRYARGRAYESFRGGMAARPARNIFVWGNFVLDEQRAKNPLYTGKKWRGLAGDVEQGFVWYQNGGFNLQAGRFASFWGGRYSLLLGPNTIMDGVAYSLRWGRVALSYRLSALDGRSPEKDGVAAFENRYLAGHRLDVHLSNRLRIGASEMVVFGGPGRQPEFAYLNPILFFHSSQLNGKANDNTLIAVDFDFTPVNRFRLYGQLLIDDFQIEKKQQSDQEPDESGLVAGFYAVDVATGWDIKAEYTRVTNRTFNQPLPRNRYLFDGQPIGAASGNDYDLGSVSVIRWLKQNLRGSLAFKYGRQGEGSPMDGWSTPWLDVSGDYSEPFPTGVVEKHAVISANLNGIIRRSLLVDVTAGLNRIANFDRVMGWDRTVPFVAIGLSAFFSTDVNVR
ncbi:hypothetical protein C3F09_08960 [candidate division GN15 bacterium]|uniref:Capsule assembly Wzi family protein n=1 Tax=candidate division GN15 bacterium TaxID=2072418 RepID=A0A855WYE7_9BACT|nr:MAG: hypothetical protein C3F09_08960 [candidate division GN15 bacterium]